MILNARMYSVSSAVASSWSALLSAVARRAGVPATTLEYPAPAPLEALWNRPDLAAVFMCGLPFARAEPQPTLVAAPVPSPSEFRGQPCYWSEFVVRADDAPRTLEDTYGSRLALTVSHSQSGCAAALTHLMSRPARPDPVFSEIIAPTITPMGSLQAVLDGTADVAPIDAFALRLMQKFRPELTSKVRVVAATTPTPIPPLVASDRHLAKALQPIFLEAHGIDSIKPMMQALCLERFAVPEAGAYAGIEESFSVAAAYWRAHRLAASVHPAFQGVAGP